MSPLIFYPVAAAAVLSALAVVTARSPVRSAMALVATLVSLAACFAMLQAHLVAALQIIVYAGAVMVLFLFVIMLLNLQDDPPETGRAGLRFGAGGVAVVLAGGFAKVLWEHSAGDGAVLAESFGTTKVVARSLFSDYLVPFELTSVLLLVAVVGAVVLARRDDAPGQD